METRSEVYDVIVIGSGMGGLTAASLCAQFGEKKVLVLERHFQSGGFTHTFKRGKFEWDVGVHYVGEMNAGSGPRAIFDLVTGGNVKWSAMPDPLEEFVYPQFKFSVPVGRDRYLQALVERFPEEREGLKGYFSDVEEAANRLGWFLMEPMLPSFLRPFLSWKMKDSKKTALRLTKDVLKDRIKNPKLIALLCSQWGDYGLPPSQSAFLMHATIVNHYLEGAYYPMGGAGGIGESVRPILEKKGGAILVNHEVTNILVENGSVKGVKVRQRKGSQGLERKFLAPTVISDAGAHTTFFKLLSSDLAGEVRSEIEALPMPTAHVSLYVGFKESPACFGFRGENHWIYESLDHDEIFQRRNELLEGRASACFLSFPSLKGGSHGHTAEIVAFLDYAPFQEWSEKPWKHRGEDYERLKEKISRALIQFVDQHYPGFSEKVDFHELSTPLSTEHFMNHASGACYGLPVVPQRFSRKWQGTKTPIKGLYLAGADAATLGVVGAMMGGVSAASFVMGWKGLGKFFKAVGGKKRIG